MNQRTWAEISTSALKKNYDYLGSLAPQSQFLGLCKANAYGHSAELVAPLLSAWGAEMLAVATTEEGAALRTLGITTPILVLGYSPEGSFPLLHDHDLVQTVYDLGQGKALDSYFFGKGKVLDIHCKVDTGMGRLGFLPSRDMGAVRELFALESLKIRGIFTHLSSSEDDDKEYYTKEQYCQFMSFLAEIQEEMGGENPPLRHWANSGAVLSSLPKGDMIRAGIALFGYDPKGCPNENLHPVLTLKSRVAVLRQLPKNSPISYGGSEVLERDSLVAVLPIGYGDGLSRRASNGQLVKIGNHFCPILGRVCMDMTMVDVTDCGGDIAEGDEVVIYGSDDLLLKASQRGDTIPYELLCQISSRVPRILVE